MRSVPAVAHLMCPGSCHVWRQTYVAPEPPLSISPIVALGSSLGAGLSPGRLHASSQRLTLDLWPAARDGSPREPPPPLGLSILGRISQNCPLS